MLLTILGLIAAVTIGALVVFRFVGGIKRHSNARNIVYAAYTLQSLPQENKRVVKAVASNILHRMSTSPSIRSWTIDQLESYKRYSLYALALAELKIPPAGNTAFTWQYVSHPFATPSNMSAVIELFERDNATKLDFHL